MPTAFRKRYKGRRRGPEPKAKRKCLSRLANALQFDNARKTL